VTFAHRLSVCVLAVALSAPLTPGAASAADRPVAPPLRDGAHDFDFNIGVWHTEIRRILNPFAGGDRSVELHGTVTVRKVWDGRAQLEEISADGPQGHWDGMTLFTYNPGAHQWSQTYANASDGVLTAPLIGAFADGRGELIAQDIFEGRTILVRGVWSQIQPDSHRFEEFFSNDGGKTWQPQFIANLTRLKP
jgi:hypothetical protein